MTSWRPAQRSISATLATVHSQGEPLEKLLNGVNYDWPVGYLPGDRLSDYWALEEHHLGQETFTHWPEGSADKNRMQGNDFVQSAMYTKGVRCWSCHDVHGTEHGADLLKLGDALCLVAGPGIIGPRACCASSPRAVPVGH